MRPPPHAKTPSYAANVIASRARRAGATEREALIVHRAYALAVRPRAFDVANHALFLRCALALPRLAEDHVLLYGLCPHPEGYGLGWGCAHVELGLGERERTALLERLLAGDNPYEEIHRRLERATREAPAEALVCHQRLSPPRTLHSHQSFHHETMKRVIGLPAYPNPTGIVHAAIPYFGSPPLAAHVAGHARDIMRLAAARLELPEGIHDAVRAIRPEMITHMLLASHHAVWTRWLRTMATPEALHVYLSMRSAGAAALKKTGARALLALIDDDAQRPLRVKAMEYAPALARTTLFHRDPTLPIPWDRNHALALSRRIAEEHPQARPGALAHLTRRASLHTLPRASEYSSTVRLLATAALLPGAAKGVLAKEVLHDRAQWRALDRATDCASLHESLLRVHHPDPFGAHGPWPMPPSAEQAALELSGADPFAARDGAEPAYPTGHNAVELYLRARGCHRKGQGRIARAASALREARDAALFFLRCVPEGPARNALRALWLAPWATPRIPSIRALTREAERWHRAQQRIRLLTETTIVKRWAQHEPDIDVDTWLSPEPGIEHATPLTSVAALHAESAVLGHCAWSLSTDCLTPDENLHFYALSRAGERTTLALVEYAARNHDAPHFEISQHEGIERAEPSARQQRLAERIRDLADASLHPEAARPYDAQHARAHRTQVCAKCNRTNHPSWTKLRQDIEAEQTWIQMHRWRRALAPYATASDWIQTLALEEDTAPAH